MKAHTMPPTITTGYVTPLNTPNACAAMTVAKAAAEIHVMRWDAAARGHRLRQSQITAFPRELDEGTFDERHRRLIWPLIWPFLPPSAAYRSGGRSLICWRRFGHRA